MQCIAPWIPAFKSGLNHETDKFVTFSIATLDTGKLVPHIRTVVYRGFLFDDESTNSIIFTTDLRSAKYLELRSNNNFEASFYFRNSSKQFRLSGQAKLITLDHYPEITLPDIINKPYEEDDETEEVGVPVLHKSFSTSLVFLVNQNRKNGGGNINDYPLFSPKALADVQSGIKNHSLTELVLSNPQILTAPTKDDYDAEFARCWNLNLSKTKSSFKQPEPKSVMDEDKRKLLDRIHRGVDGQNVNEGMKNFAVVVLLINKVDYYKDSYGNSKRLLYERVNFDQWNESEVVP